MRLIAAVTDSINTLAGGLAQEDLLRDRLPEPGSVDWLVAGQVDVALEILQDVQVQLREQREEVIRVYVLDDIY